MCFTLSVGGWRRVSGHVFNNSFWEIVFSLRAHIPASTASTLMSSSKPKRGWLNERRLNSNLKIILPCD